jgi:hypothetical protein
MLKFLFIVIPILLAVTIYQFNKTFGNKEKEQTIENPSTNNVNQHQGTIIQANQPIQLSAVLATSDRKAIIHNSHLSSLGEPLIIDGRIFWLLDIDIQRSVLLLHDPNETDPQIIPYTIPKF